MVGNNSCRSVSGRVAPLQLLKWLRKACTIATAALWSLLHSAVVKDWCNHEKVSDSTARMMQLDTWQITSHAEWLKRHSRACTPVAAGLWSTPPMADVGGECNMDR